MIITRYRIAKNVPIILDNRNSVENGTMVEDKTLSWGVGKYWDSNEKTFLSKESFDKKRPLLLNARVSLGEIQIIPGYTTNLAEGEPVEWHPIWFGGLIAVHFEYKTWDYHSRSFIAQVEKKINYGLNENEEVCAVEDNNEYTIHIRKFRIDAENEYIIDYYGDAINQDIYHCIKNNGEYYSFGEDENGYLNCTYSWSSGATTAEMRLYTKVYSNPTGPLSGSTLRQYLMTGAYLKVEKFEVYVECYPLKKYGGFFTFF